MEDYSKEIKNQNENEIEDINQKAVEVEEAKKEQEIKFMALEKECQPKVAETF